MYFSYISSTSHSLAPNSLEAPSSTPVTWLDTADRPLSSAYCTRCRAAPLGRCGSCASTAVKTNRSPGGMLSPVRGSSVKFMQFYETSPVHDLTYSDVFLVPNRSAVSSRLDVSLDAAGRHRRDHPAGRREHELRDRPAARRDARPPRRARRAAAGHAPRRPRRRHPLGQGPAGRVGQPADRVAGRQRRLGPAADSRRRRPRHRAARRRRRVPRHHPGRPPRRRRCRMLASATCCTVRSRRSRPTTSTVRAPRST